MSTQINIRSGLDDLVQVTYDAAGFSVESNLSQESTARAIARAMEKLATPMGGGEQARGVVADLRARHSDSGAFARAIAMMCSDMNAILNVPQFDVDIGEWSTEGAND